MGDVNDLFSENYRPKPLPGFIYFLYSPGMKRMKIGRSRTDPLKRICMLRTGSPDILQTIMILSVHDWEMEGFLHQVVSKHHSHGEWYNYPAMVADLRSGFASWSHPFQIVRFIGESNPVGKEMRAIATYKIPGWPEATQPEIGKMTWGPHRATGLSYKQYCRHSPLRETMRNLQVGGKISVADLKEKQASYGIANKLGFCVSVKQDDKDRWTITRTA